MGLWFYRGTVAEQLLRESPDDVFIVHRDPESADRAVASWTAPVLWRFGYGGEATESARGLAQSKTWRGLQRFMESLLGVAAVH